ncbi:MAG: PA14 domain-containing protein [Planctomycetota bacterium]
MSARPARWLTAFCLALLVACGDSGKPPRSSSAAETGAGESATPAASASAAVAQGPRRTLDLSGAGWSLFLDAAAEWEGDALHPPGVDVRKLPAHPPSGGWGRLSVAAVPGATTALAGGVPLSVSVPSTVEEHFWDGLAAERRAALDGSSGGGPVGGGALLAEPDTLGDYVGVSWWRRSFDVPAEWLANAPNGAQNSAANQALSSLRPRLALHFEAVRLRAEVFVNERLVGYDAVGNTPFEVDVTAALRPGQNTLAVRVTDPGGNFDWTDDTAHRWGNRPDAPTIPASHGFGGLSGPVRLVATRALFVQDVFVRNEADPDAVTIFTTVRNETATSWSVALETELCPGGHERGHEHGALRVQSLARTAPPGDSVHETRLKLPGVARWTLEQPTLHRAQVRLFATSKTLTLTSSGAEAFDLAAAYGPPVDEVSQRFGFRSFTVEGVGADAHFRLNGERIVLRSAISWGYWPVSGLVPLPALARRQVAAAKAFGLNMLNHHRAIAAPGLLEAQDELGLLAYCEPGGYRARGGDALCRALAREKLLRMIRRDRSRPSVVIWNLINEAIDPPDEQQRADFLAAQALDPSRAITYTSGWAPTTGDDPLKLHARPFAEAATSGWWDSHNAPGPGVSRDEHWQGPDQHLRRSENRAEIVFWGEEGAIAAPARLDLTAPSHWARRKQGLSLGWDGTSTLAARRGFEQWLAARGGAAGAGAGFAPLADLLQGAGDVALDYQARTLENVRLGDVADGYVVNGWECEPFENHSGIVDLWRNPKGRAERLAAANAAAVLVVKLRQSVLPAGGWVSPAARAEVTVLADIGLIDESARAGSQELQLALRDESGATLWAERRDVTVQGGLVFGELLARDVSVRAALEPGRYALTARLVGAPAELSGSDELLIVDWRSQALPVDGARLEKTSELADFFAQAGREALPLYHDGLPPLGFVLVGDVDPEPRADLPEDALWHLDAAGERQPGLLGRYFKARALPEDGTPPTLERVDASLSFEWSFGGPESEEPQPTLTPGGPLLGRTDYVVRWTGLLRPPESGQYLLHLQADDGAQLWLGDELLIDHGGSHSATWKSSAPVTLSAESDLPLRLEYRQLDAAATLRLAWTTPQRDAGMARLAAELLRRARNDGTRVLFLDRADVWARHLAAAGALDYRGRLEHGQYWLGGGFFARPHALLAGLPAEGALGRPWQELVHYGTERFGLRLGGEEAVIGCWSDHQYEPATALGIVEAGEGRLLFSTLDLLNSLNGPPGPADLTRKLFVNCLSWAAQRSPN